MKNPPTFNLQKTFKQPSLKVRFQPSPAIYVMAGKLKVNLKALVSRLAFSAAAIARRLCP